MVDNSTAFVKGTINNTGTISLKSGGNGSYLQLSGNTTLTGGGKVILADSANPQNFIFGAAANDILTNQETIEGSGNIGNGSMGLINNGTILANGIHSLSIQPSASGFTNNGTLQVAGSSVMRVFGGPFTNFAGTTLSGGTYNVSGTLEIDQLGSTGGEIVTKKANIILNGTGSSFIDAGGKKCPLESKYQCRRERFQYHGWPQLHYAGQLY